MPIDGGPKAANKMGICWASPSVIAILSNENSIKPTKTDTKINKPAWLNLVYLIANVAPINIIATKNSGRDNSF